MENRNISDYIRVTEVLYPFSGLDKINPDVLRNAANRGTRVHEICDAIIEEVGVGYFEPELDGYIESFNKWLPKEFIKKPDRFFCDELMLTGECDGIYKEGDDLVLFDLKTPMNESKSWMLQGSAYAYLCRKSGINIKRIEFVKLSKYGHDPKVFTYEENFELYLSCLQTYKYFYKNKNMDFELDYL